MSFKKKLLGNVLIAGSYTYISQAVSFLSSIIISRLVSPNSYGTIGLITVFTGFIAVFSDGGLSYALIRSDYGRTYQRVLTNLAWLLGILLFGITVILAYPIALFYKNQELLIPTIVLASTFVLRSLSLAQGALLAKQLKFGFIGKVTLICTVASAVITMILGYFKGGYWALIIPQIFTAIITAVLYEREVKLGFKIFPLNYIKVAYKFTRKLIGSIIGFNIISYWARNSDNMIVGKWYGVNDLGIYNRAYMLLTLPLNLITGLFSNILFPSLKVLKTQGGSVETEYYFVLRIITFLSFPLTVLFIIFPKQLIMLLWGKSWILVADLLPYFGLLIFTQTLLSTVGQLLVVEGKEREFMISGWIGGIILVVAIFAGASVSLVGVAQYYSLAFIVLILIYNLFYIYIRTLKFDKLKAMSFWLPKVAFSVALWFSLYFNVFSAKLILLLLILVYLIYDGRKEVGGLTQLIQTKVLKRKKEVTTSESSI
ncbi:oligosaccharide flippase family protein [Mucilaginibacter sp. HC2]|uniref:oligosaccharide flippase family protein n=1 Tax=Mucilaginibacter inviolabilis TaxID=2714892 RepID=UPI001408102F|nr:oligosaccharide flippase family protein [Mucilaginibacter inviolabilis]NHA04790.1 oligosaccharide flippase family protein [Mucilaginibacter inviolabilis]